MLQPDDEPVIFRACLVLVVAAAAVGALVTFKLMR